MCVGKRFIHAVSSVRPAHDHGCTVTLKMIGKFVGPPDGGDNGREPDNIGLIIEGYLLYQFVNYSYREVGWRHCAQERERIGGHLVFFPHAFDHVHLHGVMVEGLFGFDEEDFVVFLGLRYHDRHILLKVEMTAPSGAARAVVHNEDRAVLPYCTCIYNTNSRPIFII